MIKKSPLGFLIYQWRYELKKRYAKKIDKWEKDLDVVNHNLDYLVRMIDNEDCIDSDRNDSFKLGEVRAFLAFVIKKVEKTHKDIYETIQNNQEIWSKI